MRRETTPDFNTFHLELKSTLECEYSKLLSIQDKMSPCLLKIEEFLFGTRTLRSKPMSSYYKFWEQQLYLAVVKMTLANLEAYLTVLNGDDGSRCIVKCILFFTEITLEPDAPSIVEGSLLIVRGIIEGSKQFVRHHR